MEACPFIVDGDKFGHGTVMFFRKNTILLRKSISAKWHTHMG